MAPLTALTFRDEGQAKSWSRCFESSVQADARRRGLIRRRVPAWVVTLLGVAALVPAAAAGRLVGELDHRFDDRGLWAGILLYAVLLAWTARRRGMRGTAKGRAAAARRLGLKAYLEVDRAFAALPPSAVGVWDRYLAYGDALGVTPVVGTVVGLGTGNRTRVWSSFGGSWRQVRVRYPRPASRYGTAAPRLALGALAEAAAGAGLVWLYLRSAPRLGRVP